MSIPLPDAAAFGFTADWFALGLVDKCLLDRMRQEWASSGDQNTEHYRWSAFQGFLARVRPLCATLAIALYDLAQTDEVLAGSMMRELLRLDECPPELFHRALASGRPFLVRAARQRLDALPGVGAGEE
jgi:hypothetical protein